MSLSVHSKKSSPRMERALRGFDHVKRYWDKTRDCFAAKILPGEYYVTSYDEVITTVLGSCVSACIRDPVFGIGGMNHFMLPAAKDESFDGWKGQFPTAQTRYGSFAMEQLINDILKNGGSRENLEVKIVGGGKILKAMTDIGQRNIRFVEDYIRTEGLRLVGEDVGDIYPRKVVYYPQNGRAQVKKLRSMHNNTIVERETHYMDDLSNDAPAGDVELF